jgi:hypothetical protein
MRAVGAFAIQNDEILTGQLQGKIDRALDLNQFREVGEWYFGSCEPPLTHRRRRTSLLPNPAAPALFFS